MINSSVQVYSEAKYARRFQVIFVVNLWLVILPVFQLVEWGHTAPKQTDCNSIVWREKSSKLI